MKGNCHIHMLLSGADWKRAIDRHREGPEEGWIRAVLQAYRAAGYTYLRDGGDRWGVGKRARELSGEYGIQYATPLSPLYLKGHYGSFIGTGFSDLREYAGLVRKTREDGADFLKIMISGLMNFDRYGFLTGEPLPPALISEMVHIGHEEGLAVMAHANGARTVQAAAEAGVDSIEHGAYLDGDALEAMAEAGTVWVPTLSAIGNLLGKGRFDDDAVQAILDSAIENVRTFAALGGTLAPGSDAGAWAVLHGEDSEFSLMEQALGKDPWEVLEVGTQAIAERFRV